MAGGQQAVFHLAAGSFSSPIHERGQLSRARAVGGKHRRRRRGSSAVYFASLRLETGGSPASQETLEALGPYLAEPSIGTVREDYSKDGSAWSPLPFEHTHARAYRWGEDGIGGLSDRHQMICFALTLWNGRDPILKERLVGLTGIRGITAKM